MQLDKAKLDRKRKDKRRLQEEQKKEERRKADEAAAAKAAKGVKHGTSGKGLAGSKRLVGNRKEIEANQKARRETIGNIDTMNLSDSSSSSEEYATDNDEEDSDK